MSTSTAVPYPPETRTAPAVVTTPTPSPLTSWAATITAAVAAGLTTAGIGDLTTPVVTVIDAIAGLLVALHVHLALPRAAGATKVTLGARLLKMLLS